MTTKDKTILTFEKHTYDRGGYTQTEVIIRTMYQIEIRDKLAGTVDNRDGYGSDGAARWWASACGILLDEHHKFMYDPAHGALRVVLRWQHYGEDDYCEVEFDDFGRSLRQIEEGVKFTRRLGERVTDVKGSSMFPDPDTVISVLRDMRHKNQPVIEVERRSFNGSTVGVWVEPHY